MNITVRRSTKKDFWAWLDLRRKLWPGPKKMHIKEVKEFSSNRNFVCFIAWDGNAPLGFVEASIRPFANGCEERPVPFLEGIWVEPKFRRMKVGKCLLQAVEAWAGSKGFREIGSDAYITNKVSHLAHKAYGFKETERVVYFKKTLSR